MQDRATNTTNRTNNNMTRVNHTPQYFTPEELWEADRGIFNEFGTAAEFQTGIERSRIQGDINKDLVCPICQNVAYNPRQCMKCDVLVCRICIQKWRLHSRNERKDMKCPTCRTHFLSDKPKRIIMNILKGYIIRCRYYPLCEDLHPYSNIVAHETTCKYRVFKCCIGKCTFMGERRELVDHYQICSFRSIHCPNEGSGCPYIALPRCLSRHTKHCPFELLKCKYCHREFKRGEIRGHMSTACGERPKIVHRCSECGGSFRVGSSYNGHSCIRDMISSVGCGGARDFMECVQDWKTKAQKLDDAQREKRKRRESDPSYLLFLDMVDGERSCAYKDSDQVSIQLDREEDIQGIIIQDKYRALGEILEYLLENGVEYSVYNSLMQMLKQLHPTHPELYRDYQRFIMIDKCKEYIFTLERIFDSHKHTPSLSKFIKEIEETTPILKRMYKNRIITLILGVRKHNYKGLIENMKLFFYNQFEVILDRLLKKIKYKGTGMRTIIRKKFKDL